jgi:hypothetical protein
MPFVKGQSKIGGRQKGSLNKNKLAVREIVEKALGKTIPESLLEIAESLDPEKRANLLMDLMPFCYPKLQTIECTMDESEALSESKEAMHQETISWIKELFQVK